MCLLDKLKFACFSSLRNGKFDVECFQDYKRAVKTVACLKCGKETDESGVFCGGCLTEMKDYPVKPGTAVQLPHRADVSAERKKVRRQPSVNEELHRLRRLNRNLAGLALIMTLAAAALCALWLLT